MEDVLIFGSGKAAESFIKHNQNEFNIIGIIDNNIGKQGEFLGEYLISPPTSVNELEYSKVIIASMYVKEIKKQLEQDLGIDPSKIIIPSKQLLKSDAYPFLNASTLKFAESCLQELVELFNENNINYYLDYGTLLGIVRDGRLIEWDDDIDFKILSSDVNQVQKLMDEYSNLLSVKNDVIIEKAIYKKSNRDINSMCYTISEKGKEENVKSVGIDFFIMYYKENAVYQGDYVFPSHFFRSKEMIDWNGISVRVPNDTLKYLTHIYGDWEVPKKFFTFGDYNLI